MLATTRLMSPGSLSTLSWTSTDELASRLQRKLEQDPLRPELSWYMMDPSPDAAPLETGSTLLAQSPAKNSIPKAWNLGSPRAMVV